MPIGKLPPSMTASTALSQYEAFKTFGAPTKGISGRTIVQAGNFLNGTFSIEPKSKFDFIGHIARSSGAKTDNNVVRNLFLATVVKMFGGDSYDESCLPDSVREMLKLNDFDSGKPLTVRRIRAVTTAIDQYVDARTSKVEQALTAANVPVDDAVREQIRTAVRACGGDEDVFAALLSNPKDYLINAAAPNPNTLFSKAEVEQRVRDLAADVRTLRQEVPAGKEEAFRAARQCLATGEAMGLSPQLAAGLATAAERSLIADAGKLLPLLKPPVSATNIRGVIDWLGDFRDGAMRQTQALHDRNASERTRSGYKAILVSMRVAFVAKFHPKDVIRQMMDVLQSPHASALERNLHAEHKDDQLALLSLLKSALDAI